VLQLGCNVEMVECAADDWFVAEIGGALTLPNLLDISEKCTA
jgi:hypothetical protein